MPAKGAERPSLRSEKPAKGSGRPGILGYVRTIRGSGRLAVRAEGSTGGSSVPARGSGRPAGKSDRSSLGEGGGIVKQRNMTQISPVWYHPLVNRSSALSGPLTKRGN